MITYRATLDVPAQTVYLVSRWLAAHRKAYDARPWQRAATPYVQAVMVLRWFKDATDPRHLARDSRVSIATAYRYVHEAIDVIAAHGPDLHEVLTQGLREGWAFVCLDGTLIGCTRSSAPSQAGHDVWYSGKHKRHGGNIQVLTGPSGYPEWVSDVEPGSVHDITAARTRVLPALYAVAARGLPTLTVRMLEAKFGMAYGRHGIRDRSGESPGVVEVAARLNHGRSVVRDEAGHRVRLCEKALINS